MDGQGAPPIHCLIQLPAVASVCGQAPALMELPVSWGLGNIAPSQRQHSKKVQGVWVCEKFLEALRKPGVRK